MRKTPILSAVLKKKQLDPTAAQVQALIDAHTRGIKEGVLNNFLLSHVQIIAHEMNDRFSSTRNWKLAWMRTWSK